MLQPIKYSLYWKKEWDPFFMGYKISTIGKITELAEVDAISDQHTALTSRYQTARGLQV